MTASNFPSNVVQPPGPGRPWVLSEGLQGRMNSTPEGSGSFKKCEVLPTDPEWVFVKTAFEKEGPTTYGIRRIHCVYRRTISEAFHLHLSRAAEDAQAFPPKWHIGAPNEQRMRVMERWNIVAGPGAESKDVYVLPLWHGGSKEAFEMICKLGFKIRESGTDEGFFGKGNYFATTSKYAVDAYSKNGHVLLSWVSLRKPYPITFEDFRLGVPPNVQYPRLGKGGKDDHDAHYIPVVSVKPSDPFHTNYEPARSGQEPMCDEIVVFDKDQTLPAFWIELLPTLDLSSIPQLAKGLFRFVLNVLRHESSENGQAVRKLLKELTTAVYPPEEECLLIIRRHVGVAPFTEEELTENFSSSYIEYCRMALSRWESLFKAHDHITAFPMILEKLLPHFDQSSKNGWSKGGELLLSLLEYPSEKEALSPFSLLKDFIEQHPQTSIAQFALRNIGTVDSKEEIEKYLPMIEGMAKAGLSDKEHLEQYTLLSTKAVLEPLREHYLRQIAPGALFNQLALIPNCNGYRQKIRLDEEELRGYIETITQSTYTPVRVSSPFFEGPRYLKEDFFKDLLDPQGNIKREYGDKPLHNVCRLKNGDMDLHFKQKPSHPMQEYAVYSLTTRIAGKGVPASTLIRFDVELSEKPKKSYPVLVSKTVSGKNLEKIQPDTNFDRKHLTHMQLLGLLVRPGDGHASNYMENDLGEIWCIDNDASFVDPVVKSGFTTTVHFTSILYCLARQPLDPSALEEWSRLSPDLLFADWIEDLMGKEKGYVSLFSEIERGALYQKDERSLQFTPYLLSKPGLITTLYAQIHLLQQLQSDPPIDGIDLLKHLIILGNDNHETDALGTYLHLAYQKNFTKPTPSKRLEGATNKTGVSISNSQALQAALGKAPTFDEIKKKGTFCLEQLKEEFFAFSIPRQQSSVVIRQKGLEAPEVDFGKVKSGEKPDSARQLQMLEALQAFVSRQKKPPEKITLAQCAVLTPEKLRPILHKSLTHLDLRGSSLKSIPPQVVNSPLKEFYLTECNHLASVEEWGLRGSPLRFPYLEIIQVERCPQLTSLQLIANNLKELKIGFNPKLVKIFLRADVLTEVDMIGSPQVNVEQIFTLSYPEFSSRLSADFCQVLGGYMECLLKEGDFNKTSSRLGEGLLPLLKRAIQGRNFASHTSAAELKIEKIKIGVAEAKALAAVIPRTHMRTLTLKSNSMEAEVVKAFAIALPGTQITSLDLQLNFIGPNGANALADVLPLTWISSLNLQHCSVGADGAKALARALPTSQITRLDLKYNAIGDDGVDALATALPTSKITTLGLDFNSIGMQGAYALAAALPRTQITSLDLGFNSVTHDGAKVLIAALPKTKITSINLKSNGFRADGAHMLANLRNRDGAAISVIV